MRDERIKNLLRNDFIPACSDALYGVPSERAAIVTNAISCNDFSRALEWLHMCI